MKKVYEISHNICVGYKKYYNHHQLGLDCWCKPNHNLNEEAEYIWHRNYEWIDDGTRFGKWVAIKELNNE